MTRTEIITRYRHLRQISKEHHQAVLDITAPDVVLDWAKRLGLAQGRALLFDTEHEMLLAEDLATYLPRLGRSHPLDRYARSAKFALDTDQAIVLEAMRHACFSIWQVQRRHEIAGLILQDLLRNQEVWLIDEAMEQNAQPGLQMAVRLLKVEGFAMTARILVPVTPALLELAIDRAPALTRLEGDALAQDPRFAISIYRTAVITGALDAIRFQS